MELKTSPNKKELIFVALSEPVNIESNIYGDILKYLSPKFSKIHVICLGKKRIKTKNNLIFYSGKLRQWFSFFNKINPNQVSHILITDFFLGGLIASRFAKKYQIPLVYRCGGPWKYDLNSLTNLAKLLVLKITRPIVIKNCKKIIYNSKAIIQKKYNQDYAVVYNGVDTKIFQPLQTEKITPKLNLLYLGRIFHEKGIDYLLDSIKGLDQQVHLSMVGGGPELTEYQKKYPQVKFYGRVKKENIPEIINRHDVMVLPSLVESFPNVLLEAMACVKPVIATNIFGIPEMIEEGVNGFLVPPKDSKALNQAIKKFINCPEIILKMGEKAREIVKERFEKEKQMKGLEKALFEK